MESYKFETNRKFRKFTAPAAWASYLINGDDSGLSGLELTLAGEWLEAIGKGSPVDVGTEFHAYSWDSMDLEVDREMTVVCLYTFHA